jgi:hypothetical protein
MRHDALDEESLAPLAPIGGQLVLHPEKKNARDLSQFRVMENEYSRCTNHFIPFCAELGSADGCMVMSRSVEPFRSTALATRAARPASL